MLFTKHYNIVMSILWMKSTFDVIHMVFSIQLISLYGYFFCEMQLILEIAFESNHAKVTQFRCSAQPVEAKRLKFEELLNKLH